MSVSFSWSQTGDSAQARGPGITAPPGRSQSVPVQDQLQRVVDAWDPQNPQCAFQHYFYDRMPQDQAQQFTMPPGHDPAKWEKAMADRPDAASVPVLAVGFDALQTRRAQQQQQVNAYRVRLHEAADKLGELSNRHELHTTAKLAELRARHTALAAKTLRLATRLQVWAARGTGLSPEEEQFRREMRELLRRADDPSVFGSLTEVWARLQTEPRALEAERAGQSVSLDWDRDEEQLGRIAEVLAAQQKGIKFLAELLEADSAAVDKALARR